jgi:hypothetical protein
LPVACNIGQAQAGSHADAHGFVLSVKVLDCWLVAASLAVVITSPSWVENMYYFPNGSSMANLSYPSSDLAVVTVFDPTSYVAHNFTTTIANESTTEDDPGGVWWHSAMTQALQLLGTVTYVDGITSSGGIDPNGGSGYLALSALTGYPAIRRATTNYTSSDEFFSDCSKGYWTPVVLSTCGSVGTTTPYQIGANHDYAVMYTNDHGNGNRTVTLRNPWGRTEWYDLEDLMANIYGLGHLTDWNYLSWPGT